MTLQQIRLIIAAAIACLVAAPFVLNPFSITLLNYIGIYALAAIGLALLTGVGGIVSFGQAAFVGVAAYSTAWATAVNGYSPWLGLVLAVVLTCSIAAILGFVTLRLGGHFLSLSTVAWGLAIAFLFGNIDGLGQHNGISGIPPISIGPVALVESRQIYFLIWAIVVAMLLLCYNLLDSRIGRAMRALRGGNTLVESLGISAFQIKLVTFVIAAFLGALSGWLYAHLGRFVSPGPFEASHGHRISDDGDGRRRRQHSGRRGWCGDRHTPEELRAGLPAADRKGRLRPARDRGVLGAVHPVPATRPAGHRPVPRRFSPGPEAVPSASGDGVAAPRAADARHAASQGQRRAAAIWRSRRRQQCQLRRQVRRNSRADRAERRRQDHDVQPAHGSAACQQRRDRVRGTLDHPRPAIPHRPRPGFPAPSSTSSCARA